MKSVTLGFSRIAAAACAAVITATSAWAFVYSSASIERDPFQFAAVMTANASVHTAQAESLNRAAGCRTERLHSGMPVRDAKPVCQRG